MLREILDAIPSFIFVVDEDIRVLEYNTAAEKMLGLGRQQILLRRGGELLHCLHALDAPGGCGHGEVCKTCIVRGAVNEAFTGTSSIRRRVKMELSEKEEVKEFYALITVTPFIYGGRKAALLVVEDLNELAELQRIVPICMSCRKVRDDNQYWTRVEEYFKRHWDLRFSHGLCPDCAKLQMEQLLRQKSPSGGS
jgi:nitrogen fixation/metabolism regulation signal transduction histidine kinase